MTLILSVSSVSVSVSEAIGVRGINVKKQKYRCHGERYRCQEVSVSEGIGVKGYRCQGVSVSVSVSGVSMSKSNKKVAKHDQTCQKHTLESWAAKSSKFQTCQARPRNY